MKKFIFLLFLPFFSTFVSAQTPALDRSQTIAQDLSKVEEKIVDPNIWEEKNSDQPYIGLLTETDTTIHDDWSFDEDYHARVKIQKATAKNLGQWPIYYNKSREEITDIEAFIETPDGRKLQAIDIKDLPAFDQSPLYSDMRLKVISLPQINIGTVIDVRVKTKVLREEMPGQFWDEVTYPSIPTKYTRYSYIFPENESVHFSAYNNDQQPQIEKINGMVKYSFIFENTAYSDTEEFMPPPDDVIGVLSLSSVSSWKQVTDWWRGMISKNTIDDPAITAKAMDLVKDKISSKDKIRAIVEFIQDNFRYVSMSLGDHTVDLHGTDKIFKARYGDCKDLSVLTRQMLKIAGIDTNICLFSGEFNGQPQHRLPDPSAFDHVLLELIADGQEYFIDPQTKGFDLGEWPSSYDNAHVLIIEPDSYRFKDLPVAEASFHSIASTSDVTLSNDGSADFNVSVKMPVEASVDFKSSWDPHSDSSKQKFFDNLQATFAQGGKITDRDAKGLEDRYGQVEFNFKYTASNVYQVANDMVLLKEEQPGDVPNFSEDKRHYPIFLPTNSLIINRNTYHIPEGLKINFVPPDYDLRSDFMEASVKYTKDDGTITVESIYHLKRATIPRQGFADVKKFREELDKKNDMYIVLKKLSNVGPETESWIKNQ